MSQLDHCHSIFDLRVLAKKKIPKPLFDYIDGGAEDEWTLKRNRESFSQFYFNPKVLKDVSNIKLNTHLQDIEIDTPIVIAPTGMSRLFHHEGERAVCRAAKNAGTIYSLSTVSTCSIEDIAIETSGPKFFQIYAWKNQKMISNFVERCKQQQFDALLLAVDTAVFGKRERDLANGHGRPAKLRFNTAISAASKPLWLYRFLTHAKPAMANMLEFYPDATDALKVIDKVNEQFDPSITWENAKEIKQQWQGPFWLKGIQSLEDAKLAAELGVTGIIISNHAGRQLDGAPAALDILEEIVEAVGDQLEIVIDGGIMRGSDVIKALCLGANACMIGKAYLYGLAAGGEEGVQKSIDILNDEMRRVMALIGCNSISELNPSIIRKLP